MVTSDLTRKSLPGSMQAIESESDEENCDLSSITVKEAGEAVLTLESFIEQNGTSKAMDLIEKMKECFYDIRSHRSQQSKITKFFENL